MLAELAELSFDPEQCEVIYAVLDYRIKRPEHKWRCTYKALQVLEYLLKRGSEQCIAAAEELLVPLAALQNFVYIGPDGRDYGQNVRLRSEAVRALVLDKECLAQQRAQIAARAPRYSGYARHQLPITAAGQVGSSGAGVWGGGGSGGGSGGGAMGSPRGSGSLDSTGHLAHAAQAVSGSPPRSVFPLSSAAAHGARSISPPAGAGAAGLPRAGETKGITFAANQRQLEQLRMLLALEGNRQCADCQSGSACARPSWASINLGVFICMRCAGIHRGLGVHVSKVRSTTLDTWLPEQVALMARLGNQKANTHFEARLDPGLRPSADRSIQDMERFIRLKYADRAWAAPGPWPPEDALANGSAAAAQPSSGAAAATAAAVLPPPPAGWLAAPGAAPGVLSPPPSSGPAQLGTTVKAALGLVIAPPPAAAGSSAPEPVGNLLMLDSTDEEEEEESAAARAAAGGAPGGVGSSGGGAPGSTALWDLLDLDPRMDVMTWLERRESVSAVTEAAAAASVPSVQGRGGAATIAHAHTASAPVSSSTAEGSPWGMQDAWPTPAAAPASGPQQQLPPQRHAHASSTSGSAAGRAPLHTGGTTASSSVIETSEFPVYDLLTPLHTGMGPPAFMLPGQGQGTPQARAPAATGTPGQPGPHQQRQQPSPVMTPPLPPLPHHNQQQHYRGAAAAAPAGDPFLALAMTPFPGPGQGTPTPATASVAAPAPATASVPALGPHQPVMAPPTLFPGIPSPGAGLPPAAGHQTPTMARVSAPATGPAVTPTTYGTATPMAMAQARPCMADSPGPAMRLGGAAAGAGSSAGGSNSSAGGAADIDSMLAQNLDGLGISLSGKPGDAAGAGAAGRPGVKWMPPRRMGAAK